MSLRRKPAPRRRPDDQAPTFRLRYVACGQATCRTCAGHRHAHGPYWFASGRGGRRYAGTRRPAGVSAAHEAAERQRARDERDRKDRSRAAKQAQPRTGRARAQVAPPSRDDDLGRLGLGPGATAAEARRAFRARALACHPDRPGGSTEAMQALNQSYERLLRGFAFAGEG